MVDNTQTDINLYLVNSSLAEFKEITAEIIDENNAIIKNALVKTLRYDLSQNSFTTREIRRSNFEGETFLDIVQNEEFYKFQVFINGILLLTTEQSVITKDTIILQVNLGELIGQLFFDTQAANGIIIYNNDTSVATFSFADSGNTITQACLELFRISSTEETLLNQTCVLGSSGAIIMSPPAITDTNYKFVGTVFVGSTERFADAKLVSFKSVSDLGSSGWLMNLFLTLMFAGLGAFNPVILPILVPLPTLFLTMFNWINFSWEFAIGFEIAGFIVAYIISRKS